MEMNEPEARHVVHEGEGDAGDDHHGAEDAEKDLDGEARLGVHLDLGAGAVDGDVLTVRVAADALREGDDARDEAAHALAHQVAVQVRGSVNGNM